ncbi:MAG: DUF5034 domain-containing protein [Marinilabiliaceae bacterium]|nr:DUF5034 domain-containing protein [Marinilabiliaceae bacterium]
MKILKVIVILLVLLIADLIVSSCIRCPETFSFEYSFTSLVLHPIDNEEIMSIMGCNVGDADANPHIFRKDFGITIEFKTSVTKLAQHKQVSSFIVQTAYALDCEEDKYYAKENIVSIGVFSDKDFGETHPAGTNIADFFQIREYFGNIDEFGPFPWLVSFDDYFNRPQQEYDYVSFNHSYTCLITATDVETGEYEFNFVVKLSDDRILEQSITAILK